ncbi:unnamed protein product, partial [Ilex paraguariensis]
SYLNLVGHLVMSSDWQTQIDCCCLRFIWTAVQLLSAVSAGLSASMQSAAFIALFTSQSNWTVPLDCSAGGPSTGILHKFYFARSLSADVLTLQLEFATSLLAASFS